MRSPVLTERRGQVLDFLRTYFAANDQLPSCQAIADHFGFRPNAANDHLVALERLRHIERNACGKFRFARQASTPVLNWSSQPGQGASA